MRSGRRVYGVAASRETTDRLREGLRRSGAVGRGCSYSPEYLERMVRELQGKQADLVKLSAWMWCVRAACVVCFVYVVV